MNDRTAPKQQQRLLFDEHEQELNPATHVPHNKAVVSRAMSYANRTIVQKNDLVFAQYDLSMDEQRLIEFALSHIDSKKAPPNRIVIDAGDFAAHYDLDRRTVYGQLQAASERLYKRNIVIFDRDRGKRIQVRWIDAIADDVGGLDTNKEGTIELSFSQHIKPYISNLSKDFTSYSLSTTSQYRCKYSRRIHSLVHSYRRFGYFSTDVDGLRDMLMIGEDEYKRFTDFYTRVVKTAVTEINQHNPTYALRVTKVKKGRTVRSLKFSFTYQ